MESVEARKLKLLLAELDRLCAEAQEVRERIDQLARERPVWPDGAERRYSSQQGSSASSQQASANDSPTPALHGRKV